MAMSFEVRKKQPSPCRFSCGSWSCPERAWIRWAPRFFGMVLQGGKTRNNWIFIWTSWINGVPSNPHHLYLWRFAGKVTCSRLWLNVPSNSSFEDSMARPPVPRFAWNDGQNSSFEGSMPSLPAPGFSWMLLQNSRFKNSMARLFHPDFVWKFPKFKYGKFDGKVTCSRLWLNFQLRTKIKRVQGRKCKFSPSVSSSSWIIPSSARDFSLVGSSQT